MREWLIDFLFVIGIVLILVPIFRFDEDLGMAVLGGVFLIFSIILGRKKQKSGGEKD